MKRSDKHNRFRECITAFARPKTNRFFRPSVLLVFFNLLAFPAFSAPQDIKNDQNILREEIKALSTAKLRSIEPILEQLEKRGAIYLPLFQALLNGQLYFKKEQPRHCKARSRSERQACRGGPVLQCETTD